MIIDHLRRRFRGPVLYYYFNFRSGERQTCENLVRSLMYQLVYILEETPSAVKELYSSHNRGLSRPSIDELTTCLVAVIGTLEEVHLLGDAFDECSQWNSLSKVVKEFAKSACPSLHFLFTSRPEQHIEDLVGALDIPSVDLTCEELDRDIEKFVSETLQHDLRFLRIPDDGKTLIHDSLTIRSAGM
jgi:hypothetical protein